WHRRRHSLWSYRTDSLADGRRQTRRRGYCWRIPYPRACGARCQAASRFRTTFVGTKFHGEKQDARNLAVLDSGRSISFFDPKLSYDWALQLRDRAQGLAERLHLQDRKRGLRQSRGIDESPIVCERDNSDQYRSRYNASAAPRSRWYYREAGIAVPPGAVVGN